MLTISVTVRVRYVGFVGNRNLTKGTDGMWGAPMFTAMLLSIAQAAPCLF